MSKLKQDIKFANLYEYSQKKGMEAVKSVIEQTNFHLTVACKNLGFDYKDLLLEKRIDRIEIKYTQNFLQKLFKVKAKDYMTTEYWVDYATPRAKKLMVMDLSCDPKTGKKYINFIYPEVKEKPEMALRENKPFSII